MRNKIFQKWTSVVYGETKGFTHWSNLVLGLGDENLKQGDGFLKWKKLVILIPSGNSDVRFQVGFYGKGTGICGISSTVRMVGDGPYAMRMGPEDCNFFVVSNDGPVELKIAGYVRKDMDLY